MASSKSPIQMIAVTKEKDFYLPLGCKKNVELDIFKRFQIKLTTESSLRWLSEHWYSSYVAF